MSLDRLEDLAYLLIKKSVTTLPDDVKLSLRKALSSEKSEVGRKQLETILLNIELAEAEELPLCQDTGLFSFYIDLDPRVYDPLKVKKVLVEALRRATIEIPLRPNAVHPLTRENSGDNVGLGIPYFEWTFNREGYLELTVAPKGAGSENMTKLAMLPPHAGLKGIIKFVVDSVVQAGGAPCPPTVLGVGVGGLAEEALKLAKQALLRPLSQPNPDPELRRLEALLLEKVNETGVGPMGLGGSVTALAVHVNYAHTHTASLPVALAFQCWATRRATLRVEGSP
ncbi:MAG: fumarate hydratase [Thermoprotei archaeon]|nr:MAG: fumarate hydratase [Thermoprotei archaeon]